jgi:SAM-dependent methyltransferase
MKEINSCEVCDSKDLTMVLDLGLHPLCDDLIEIGSNKQCQEYPVEILFCNTCKTAHQRYQVPKRELFGEKYHYRARMTGSVLKGMEDLVESCVHKIGNLENKLVLDIGCNDGSLLDYFKNKGCETIGVEPTGAALDSKHYTYNKFFDDETVELILNKFGKPDIITFTNVFAHIEDLNGLINNLKKLLKPNTYVVIENHYLGAVLNYSQFDTFYHEHPRTYSFESFKYIAKKLGLNLIDCEFVSRYGGNIRAFLSSDNAIDFLSINENDFINKFGEMNVEILNWKFKTQLKIKKLVEEFGPIRAKAFPGRAAILIKMLGLTEKSISAVYEIKGSIKVHNYVPGTRIPILPEADLYKFNNEKLPILNLAWHLPKEVRENLKKNKYNGVVIDIKDFKLN